MKYTDFQDIFNYLRDLEDYDEIMKYIFYVIPDYYSIAGYHMDLNALTIDVHQRLTSRFDGETFHDICKQIDEEKKEINDILLDHLPSDIVKYCIQPYLKIIVPSNIYFFSYHIVEDHPKNVIQRECTITYGYLMKK